MPAAGDLPAQLLCVAGLRVLALRRALLTALPDALGGSLPALVELDLSDGHLATLPRSIGALQRLRKLTLFKNHLMALPDELGDCLALVELNVFDNRLTSLPPGIAELERLEDVRACAYACARARAHTSALPWAGARRLLRVCVRARARAAPAPHPTPAAHISLGLCPLAATAPLLARMHACAHALQLNVASNRLTQLPRAAAGSRAAGHQLWVGDVASGAASRARRQHMAAAVGGAGSIGDAPRLLDGAVVDECCGVHGDGDGSGTPSGGGGGSDGGSIDQPGPTVAPGEGAGLDAARDAEAPAGVVYRWRALKRLAVHMNQLEALPDLSSASATLRRCRWASTSSAGCPRWGRRPGLS